MVLLGGAAPAWTSQMTAAVIREPQLRRLADQYIAEIAQASEQASDDQPKPNPLPGIAEAEDRLLAGASRGSAADRAIVWRIVADGRLELNYRSPVDVAELAIKANAPDAALLALDLGRIQTAVQIMKRPGARTSKKARHQIDVARRLVQEDSPARKCRSGNVSLCETLYDLLALPPSGYSDRMRDLDKSTERAGSTFSDSPDDNRPDFARFLLGDAQLQIKRPEQLTITTHAWKTVAIPPDTGRALADYFRAGARRTPSKASSIVDLFLERPELRAILGDHPRLVNGAKVSPERSDIREFLSVHNALSIGDRHFLIMRVESGPEGCAVVLEVSGQQPDRIDYWRGDLQAGGLTISPAPLLGDSRPLLIVARTEMTSGYLTLWLVDPQMRRTTQIFDDEEAYHGTFFTADMGTNGRHSLLISRSTGDGRYGTCMQCPSRVQRLVFRMSPDGKSLNLVAKFVSWDDIGTGTNAGLFGIGPEMFRQNLGAEVQASMDKLSAADVSDEDFRAGAASLETAAWGLFSTEANAEALVVSTRAIEFLDSHPRSVDGLADILLSLRMTAARAHLKSGDVKAAEAQLGDPHIESIKDPGLKQELPQLQLELARATGGLGKQYEVLQAMLSQRPDAAEPQGHLAEYLLEVGNDEQALAVSRRASDARVRGLMPWRADLYSTLRAQVALGDYDAALTSVALLLRASAMHRSSGASARALLTASEIARRTHNLDAAQKLFDAGLARMDSATWQQTGPASLLLYSRLLEQTRGPRDAMRALDVAMRLVNRDSPMFAVIQDQMATEFDSMANASAASAASRRAFDAILRQQVSVAEESNKLAFVSSSAEIAERHIARLLRNRDTPPTVLVDAVERWRAQVLRSMRQGPRAAVDAGGSPASTIADLATGVSAYVSYYLAGSRPVALVAERGAFRVVRLSIDAKALERARLTVRRLTDINNDEVKQAVWLDRTPVELRRELAFLHDRLIADLHLNPTIRKVVAVPDERLYWVPWPALVPIDKNTTRRTLFDTLAVVITPSVSLLVGQKPRAASPKYLAVGAVDPVPPVRIKAALPDMFVEAPPFGLPELPSAQVEIADIDATLPPRFEGRALLFAQHETVPDAHTLDSLLSAMSSATIVHVAAHGIFDARDPMSSAIFLSGAGPEVVLRPSHLASTNLQSVSLLTLSACQTGMSNVRKGAEAIGFVRGAMVGGAHRVMLTNWVVEDRATQEFFKAFYTRIGLEMPFVDAYRDAVVELSKRYAHPFFWAAYAMYSTASPSQ